MTNSTRILNSLVPITQFNKGQAARIFDRVKTERQLVVLKNNLPSAIILSPEEYKRLLQIEEDYELLSLAESRLKKTDFTQAVIADQALEQLGVIMREIDMAGDIEIE